MVFDVHLTPYEQLMAVHVGVARRLKSVWRGCRDRYGIKGEEVWFANINGACGECAFAKWLGIYWNGSEGVFKVPDVGDYYVRTMSRHSFDLLMRPDDNDGLYVMVTGMGLEFKIQGWLSWPNEYKKEENLTDEKGRRGEPAWFVPKSYLRDIRELRNV
jgi:hypothetical protein